MKKNNVLLFVLIAVLAMLFSACGAPSIPPTLEPTPEPELEINVDLDSAVVSIVLNSSKEQAVHIEVYADDGQRTESWRSVLNIDHYMLNKGANSVSGKFVSNAVTTRLKVTVKYDGGMFEKTLTSPASKDTPDEPDETVSYSMNCGDDNSWFVYTKHSSVWAGYNPYGLAIYVDNAKGDVPFLTFADADPGQSNWVKITVPADKQEWFEISFEGDRRSNKYYPFVYEGGEVLPSWCKK